MVRELFFAIPATILRVPAATNAICSAFRATDLSVEVALAKVLVRARGQDSSAKCARRPFVIFAFSQAGVQPCVPNSLYVQEAVGSTAAPARQGNFASSSAAAAATPTACGPSSAKYVRRP
ncbi:unnamed protein product [Polarella glacialis]|uniref:Uncharacterized protein n=1 Tax=Polarella glacialis TaxID=89957 RepID=A0A813GFZ7_POLGL|nr:unnamed protein product [Polarella glacialis]